MSFYAFQHPPLSSSAVRPPRGGLVTQIDLWLERASPSERERLYPFAARASSLVELQQLSQRPEITHVVVAFVVSGRRACFRVCELLEHKLLVVFAVYSPRLPEIARAALSSTVVITRTAALAISSRDRDMIRAFKECQRYAGEGDLCESDAVPLEPRCAVLARTAVFAGCASSGCTCLSQGPRLHDNWLVASSTAPRALCGICGHVAGDTVCGVCGCGVCDKHADYALCGCNTPPLPQIHPGTTVTNMLVIEHTLWRGRSSMACLARVRENPMPDLQRDGYLVHGDSHVDCMEALCSSGGTDAWRSAVELGHTGDYPRLVLVFLPVRSLVQARALLRMPGFLPFCRTGVAGSTAFVASVVAGRRLAVPFHGSRELRLCAYLQTLHALSLVIDSQLAAQLALGSICLDDFVAQRYADGQIQVCLPASIAVHVLPTNRCYLRGGPKVRMQCACDMLVPLPSVAPTVMRQAVDRLVYQLAHAVAVEAPDLAEPLRLMVTRTASEAGVVGPELGSVRFEPVVYSGLDADIWSARSATVSWLLSLSDCIAGVLNAPLYAGRSAGMWAASFSCSPGVWR